MSSTRPPAARSAGRTAWTSASGATALTREDPLELVGGQLGERGQRARAEVAGVVDEQVEAGPDGRGQRRPVPGVGDVAGDGGDQVGPGEAGDGRGQPGGVAAVDDEPPAAVVQGGGERAAEPSGGAGDECGGRVLMGLPSDLKWT